MPLLDFVKNLTQREKTKTKERSADNKYITKTKEVKIPLEGGQTKVVTKKVKRPTLLGGATDKKEVTRNVRYESNSPSKSEKEMAGSLKSANSEVGDKLIENAYNNAQSEQRKGRSAEEIKNKTKEIENRAKEEWNNIVNSAIEKNKSKKIN